MSQVGRGKTKEGRAHRKGIAEETVAICSRGSYLPSGKHGRVDLREALESCRANTEVVVDPQNTALWHSHETAECYGDEQGSLKLARAALAEQRSRAENSPEAVLPCATTGCGPLAKKSGCLLSRGSEDSEATTANAHPPMMIEVVVQTTIGGIRDLAEQGYDVCALNFASAKNPGGGFLRGSQAQEECLARATGIYHAIGSASARELYSINRADNRQCLYSDALAYSPGVPVFRDDNDRLLPAEEVCRSAFVTCPAVNAKIAVPRTSTETVQRTMFDRICKIVSEMEKRKHDAIVLGSFGCGVFGNRIQDVAYCFAHALAGRKFRRVRFSVISERDAQVFRQTLLDEQPRQP